MIINNKSILKDFKTLSIGDLFIYSYLELDMPIINIGLVVKITSTMVYIKWSLSTAYDGPNPYYITYGPNPYYIISETAGKAQSDLRWLSKHDYYPIKKYDY